MTDPQDNIATTSKYICPGLELEDGRLKGNTKTLFVMFKYRAFETALLLNPRPLSLIAVNEPKLKYILRKARLEHQLLTGLFSYHMMSSNFPEDVREVLDEFHQAAGMRYMNGYHWRLLSPRTGKAMGRKHPVDLTHTAVFDAAMDEARICNTFGVSGSLSLASACLLKTFDRLDLNLKAVGSFLRNADSKIKSEDDSIP